MIHRFPHFWGSGNHFWWLKIHRMIVDQISGIKICGTPLPPNLPGHWFGGFSIAVTARLGRMLGLWYYMYIFKVKPPKRFHCSLTPWLLTFKSKDEPTVLSFWCFFLFSSEGGIVEACWVYVTDHCNDQALAFNTTLQICIWRTINPIIIITLTNFFWERIRDACSLRVWEVVCSILVCSSGWPHFEGSRLSTSWFSRSS